MKIFFVDGTNKEREFIRGTYISEEREQNVFSTNKTVARAPNDNFYVILFFSFAERERGGGGRRNSMLRNVCARTQLWSRKRDDCKVGATVKEACVSRPYTCLRAARIPKEVVADKTGLTGIERPRLQLLRRTSCVWPSLGSPPPGIKQCSFLQHHHYTTTYHYQCQRYPRP